MSKKNQKKQKPNKLDRLFEKMLTNKTLRVQAVKQDFEWFFPIYFHKRLEYPTAPFQAEIIKLLRDCRKKFLVITAFRGSAKTTLTSVAYVLWAVFGSEQKKYVLLVGQTEIKARRNLANLRRQLETNDLLRRDLGPIDEEKDQWGATAFIIRKLNAKIAIASVGQSVRGLLHDEYRPDLVVCDDLESLESVRTQESRNNLSDWFGGELLPVGDKRTRFIVVGNLLHEDSLMRRLQRDIENGERDGEFREYAFFDTDGITPLWPGKYPTSESIEEEKRLIKDPIAWAREYLLKILPRDEQLIRPEWIQRYDTLPTERPRFTLIGIDPAISTESSADYTAMVAIHAYGSRENLRIYVSPHIVNKRLTFAETVREAETLSQVVGMGSKAPMVIEKVAYQQALIEHMKSRGNSVQGISPGGTDKYARLASVTHYLEIGKTFFPKGAIADVLVNQLLGFQIEKHDDLVDAFAWALHEVMHKDRYGGAYGISWNPPREEDMLNLSSREKQVIWDKYHASGGNPFVIKGGRSPMPAGWKQRWDR